ncbi:MAG: hypothetical protein ACE5JD_09150 [Candidatus Methylomirabilia bacterium]
MERVGDATSQLLFATALVALVYVGLAVELSPLMTGLAFACAGKSSSSR